MPTLKAKNDIENKTSGGTVRFWPFRQPLAYADALSFLLSILAAVVGVVIGMVEQSWAFAAIAFLLGVATFQEYWTRVERLSVIAAQQESIVALASSASETIRRAVTADLEHILDERLRGVGAQIRLFETKEEFLKDKARRLGLVRKEILDTNFNYHPARYEPSPKPSPSHNEYDELLKRKIHQENVILRKVVFVNNLEQLERLVANLEQEKGQHNYYIGCYVGIPENVPYLESIIFDNEEAYIGGYRGTDWSLGEFNVFVRDAAVVKVLTDYHRLLWGKSIQLNGGKGDEIRYDRVGEIRKLLTEGVKKIQVFSKRDIVYERLIQGLANAQRTIDIISFHQLLSPDEHRQDYYTEMEQAIQRGLHHRRIIWNADHVKWIKVWLKKYENNPYLEVHFYDEKILPRIEVTFDLIDKERGILFQGLVPPYIVEITEPDVNRVFSDYFEELWGRSGSMTIKDYHSGVNWKLLEQLEQRFGINR